MGKYLVFLAKFIDLFIRTRAALIKRVNVNWNSKDNYEDQIEEQYIMHDGQPMMQKT